MKINRNFGIPFSIHVVIAFFFPAFVFAAITIYKEQWIVSKELLSSTGVALVFILSVLGWGMTFLRVLPNTQTSRLESAVISLILGLFVIYSVSIVAGLFGIFRPKLLIAVHSLGMILLVISMKTVHQQFPKMLHWKFSERLMLMAILLILGFQFVSSWTPLIFYDSLVYHLYAPSEFFKAGSLIYLPFNLYTNSPLSIQLITGTTLALDPSGQSFKIVLNLLGCLVPLSLALFLWKENRNAALVAALLAAVYPGFWVPQALGTIDIALAAFLVLGAHWYRSALVFNNKTLAMVSGIALGFVASSRYQGLILIAVILLVLSLKKRKAEILIITGSAIFVMLLPWLCRNFSNTGDPFYPLGTTGEVDLARLNHDVLGPSFDDVSNVQKLLAPLGLLLLNPPNRLFGALLLIGGILALIKYRSSMRMDSAAWIGFLGLICWSIIHPWPGGSLLRFNAASILFLTIATAGALVSRFHRAATVTCVLLAGIFFYFAWQDLTATIPVLPSVTDQNFRTGFQKANIPGYAAFEFCNQNPKSGKVLLLGETRGFCVKSACIASSIFDSPKLLRLLPPDSTPHDWQQNLKRIGVDRILICIPEWRRLQTKGYLPFSNEQKRRLIAWLQMQRLEFNDGKDTVVISLMNE